MQPLRQSPPLFRQGDRICTLLPLWEKDTQA